MVVRVITVVLGAVACLHLAACGAERESVARLARVSQPHLDAFARFERWVHRAHDGATALSGPALVREAAFSPIRNRTRVLAAAIESDRPHSQRMVFPPQARFPARVGWVDVRHPEHGILDVAALAHCDLDLPAWWRRGVSRRCVLISRATSRGVAERLTVTVAFSASDPDPPRQHASARAVQ